MKTFVLNNQDVLRGYDAVADLYPYVPPLSHWRAWEYAAYQRYKISGRILDLGCGDGRYFRLIWPNARDVVGVDMNPEVVALAKQSGIYNAVHVVAAHEVPEESKSFDHVFANCSLEHMDHLDSVLKEIRRCLKPGGTLLCSVVTERFVQWSLLNNLFSIAGFNDIAAKLLDDFLSYHHLANPLPVKEWEQRFVDAALVPEEHIPILPLFNSGIFLLMDNLWHVKRASGGEMGDVIYPFLSSNPNFASAFRKVVSGLLDMEVDRQDCSGAVFMVRKPW